MLSFFQTLGAGWVNLATVVSAVFGTLFAVFALAFSVTFSRKLSASTDALLRESTKLVGALKQHTKNIRLESLRLMYELSKSDERARAYWEFRWRFETFDRLGVTLSTSGEPIATCFIRIQGVSNAPEHVGFENTRSEFYVVKVNDLKIRNPGIAAPFSEGQLAACFWGQSRGIISRGTDPWTEHPQFELTIVGLGEIIRGTGDKTVDDVNVWPRVKDC